MLGKVEETYMYSPPISSPSSTEVSWQHTLYQGVATSHLSFPVATSIAITSGGRLIESDSTIVHLAHQILPPTDGFHPLYVITLCTTEEHPVKKVGTFPGHIATFKTMFNNFVWGKQNSTFLCTVIVHIVLCPAYIWFAQFKFNPVIIMLVNNYPAVANYATYVLISWVSKWHYIKIIRRQITNKTKYKQIYLFVKSYPYW